MERMVRMVRFVRPRVVDVVSVEPLAPGAGEVRIETLYSGISAGTELTAYRGSNPYLHRVWDSERRLFAEGAHTVDYPVTGWGYEEVGRVVEIDYGFDAAPTGDAGPGDAASGGPRLAVGDVVWGIWGHRGDGVLPLAAARHQILPPHVDPLHGVFARVGAVALNAVIEADLHVGETVVIFGQGVIGLLATQLAAASGADVVAVDALEPRLELARRFGARHTVRAGAPGPSAAEVVRELTGNRGADVCIELSGSYRALGEAVRTAGYNSRVVAAGFYQGGAEALRLGEEFHHNRIELVCSQISGPPARYAHRWTRERLHRDFMRLLAQGRIDVSPLIDRVLPVEAAADAFTALDDPEQQVLQCVLDFQER
jgi:2-desacetyl-2-hydroxyethyl bacteriochlorophyllide A dehydrogenase